MNRKEFWTLFGFGICIWSLIIPNLPRALIGITFFIIGCMQSKVKR